MLADLIFVKILVKVCSFLIPYFNLCSENGDMCAMKEVTLFSDDAKSKESAKQLMQVIFAHV